MIEHKMGYSIKLLFITKAINKKNGLNEDVGPFRRSFYQYDPREVSKILGVPGAPSHLPQAEDILPAHTLIRPTLGMLKSSVKFPHKDLEDGSGVYGNMESLGESYGRNERIAYSGFRRSPSDYIMIVPNKYNGRTSVNVLPVTLDLDKKERAKSEIQKILQGLSSPLKGNVKVIYQALDRNDVKNKPVKYKLSYYVDESDYPEYKVSKGSRPYDDSKLILRIMPGVGKEEKYRDLVKSTEVSSVPEKLALLWNTKNQYNHLKVDSKAIDINELVPPEAAKLNKIRQWWFYNQDDYKPFQD